MWFFLSAFFPDLLLALYVHKNTFLQFLTFEVLYSSWGSTKRRDVSSFVETTFSTCEMYMLTSFNAARYASRSARSCKNIKNLSFATNQNVRSSIYLMEIILNRNETLAKVLTSSFLLFLPPWGEYSLKPWYRLVRYMMINFLSGLSTSISYG